jgi:hypothetical protein
MVGTIPDLSTSAAERVSADKLEELWALNYVA